MTVTYHKHWLDKNFISIFLADRLFKDKEKIQNKIIEMIRIFELDNLSVKCVFFVENNNSFLAEIENIIGRKAEVIVKDKGKKGKIFRRPASSSMTIIFKGTLLGRVLELGIKHEESLDIECFDESNITFLKAALFDNDGSCINFNIEKYDTQTIKDKVNRIFN